MSAGHVLVGYDKRAYIMTNRCVLATFVVLEHKIRPRAAKSDRVLLLLETKTVVTIKKGER
jgi:hypothetical protein